MSKKLKKSKSKARATKRRIPKLTSIIALFFETVWALGVSVVAAMVISTSTRRLPVFMMDSHPTPRRKAASPYLGNENR